MNRCSFVSALALCAVLLSAATETRAADVVIVSPPALTNAWNIYVDYRKTTHPDLTFEIKNTEEIYAAYPDAVNKTAYAGPRWDPDYALAIHKYVESVYQVNSTNLTVILGAEPPKMAYATNPQTQIPLRYVATTVSGDGTGDSQQTWMPTDLYFACMDKTMGEVWDPQMDGIYRGTGEEDALNVTMDTTGVDLRADISVMRFPLSATNPEGVMTAYVAKLRKAESDDFTGRYRYMLVGNKSRVGSANPYYHYQERTGARYLAEYQFFDGQDNLYDVAHPSPARDSEVQPRWAGSTFYTATRAVKSMVAAGGELRDTSSVESDYNALLPQGGEGYYVYGHGKTTGMEDGLYTVDAISSWSSVYKFCFAVNPCMTGHIDDNKSGTCVGVAGVLSQNGGFLVSYNNVRNGLSRSTNADGFFYTEWSGHLDDRLNRYVHGAGLDMVEYNAGDALKKARQDYADDLPLMAEDSYSTDIRTFCLLNLMGYGDPLVKVTPQPDLEWASGATGLSSDTSRSVVASTTDSSATYIVPAGEEYATSQLYFSGPANGAFTLTGGKFRTMGKTIVYNAKTLTWEAEGGTAHNGVLFVGGNGTLVLPGTATRYFGTKFTNVDAINVPGSNVTLDFGSETPISTSVNFCSDSASNRSTYKNIVRTTHPKTTASLAANKTITVENSTLELESAGVLLASSGAQAAIAATNANVVVKNPPQWGKLTLSRDVELNNSDLSVDYRWTQFGGSSPWTIRATGGTSTFKITANATTEWESLPSATFEGGPVEFVVADNATMQIPLSRPSTVTVSANLASTGRLLFETTQSALDVAQTTPLALCNVADGAANTPFTTQVDFCTASGIPLSKNGLYTYAENGVVYVCGTQGGDPDEPDEPDTPPTPTHRYEFNGNLNSSGTTALTLGNSEKGVEYETSANGQAMKTVNNAGHPWGSGMTLGDDWLIAASIKSIATENALLFSVGNIASYGFALISGGEGRVLFTTRNGRAHYQTLITANVPTATTQYHLYTIRYKDGYVTLAVDGAEVDTVQMAKATDGSFQWGGLHGGVESATTGYVRDSGVCIDEFRMYHDLTVDADFLASLAEEMPVWPLPKGPATANITGDVTWSTKVGTADWSDEWENDSTRDLILTNKAETCTFWFDSGLTAKTVKIVGGGTVNFTGNGVVSAPLDLSEFTGTIGIDSIGSRWTTITAGSETTIDFATFGLTSGTLAQPITLTPGTTLRFAPGDPLPSMGYTGRSALNLPSMNLSGVKLSLAIDDAAKNEVDAWYQCALMAGNHSEVAQPGDDMVGLGVKWSSEVRWASSSQATIISLYSDASDELLALVPAMVGTTHYLKVSASWIQTAVPEVTTVAEAEAAYLSTAPNGYSYWESYVAGIEPTNKLEIAEMIYDAETGCYTVTGNWSDANAHPESGLAPTLVLEASDDLAFTSVTEIAANDDGSFSAEKGGDSSKFYRFRIKFTNNQ